MIAGLFSLGRTLLVGLASVVSGTLISRVQSGVKSIGLFFELNRIHANVFRFGFNGFVLIHVVGHSFLRAYQFLVSPSVLSYLSHHMISILNQN